MGFSDIQDGYSIIKVFFVYKKFLKKNGGCAIF